MNEQTFSFYSDSDRRSATGFNRFRRTLNNYWLIPLIICYLQLATQVVYTSDSPFERLKKGNLAFVQGIPIAYEIATHEFPFTLIGHFYEIAQKKMYDFDLFQIPNEDLNTAFATEEVKQAIYDRLVESRAHHDSEIGGLLSLSYEDEKPVVRLYEITSLNEVYLNRLRRELVLPLNFAEMIRAEESEEIFRAVGIQKDWVESTAKLINNERVTEETQDTVAQNFVEMYEALSESRYLLSPYQLKEGLGRIPFSERFVGIFHFHNGMNEPPSSTDIRQSLRNRQIVMTFQKEGWSMYDLQKQVPSRLDLKIEEKAF